MSSATPIRGFGPELARGAMDKPKAVLPANPHWNPDLSKEPETTPAPVELDAAGRKVRKGFKRCSAVETIRINELLREHIKMLSDGLCEYKDDLSDAKIAEMIGKEGIGAGHVAYVRLQVFGKLYHRDPEIVVPSEVEELRKRLDVAETRLNAVLDWLRREMGVLLT